MKDKHTRSFNLQRLKFERLSRNITQEEMANSLGITANAYYKKESGMNNISVEEFGIIIDRLGIPSSKAGIFFTFDVPERERVI